MHNEADGLRKGRESEWRHVVVALAVGRIRYDAGFEGPAQS